MNDPNKSQEAPIQQIRSLRDLIDCLGETERHFGRHNAVFRGHTDLSWDLVPSIFRNDRAHFEYSYMQEFRHAAPARVVQCPEFNDLAAWLAMMQHHGLPTRLLDWSKSILVAAFFAAWNHKEKHRQDRDGAVWAINMMDINERTTRRRGMLSLPDLACSAPGTDPYNLFHDAFMEKKQSAKLLYAVVSAPQRDQRLYAQQGLFTIHNFAVPLNRQDGAELFCKMFRVPSVVSH